MNISPEVQGGIIGALIGGLLFSLIQRFSTDGLNEWEIVYSVAFSLIIVFIIWLIAKIELLQKSRKPG